MRRIGLGRATVLAVAVGTCFAACAEPPHGYDAPRAVVHDPVADVWLVANRDAVGGYVARVEPAGGMERHWIRHGSGGVTLRAPTGLALGGDLLWVADGVALRAFDRVSGAPRGAVPIPGATALADVAVGPDGAIWCSDRGVTEDGRATGTDAIWRLADGTLPPHEPPIAVCRGADLGQPTALVARTGSVYVVGRDGQFFSVDAKGRRSDLATAPARDLVGLVRVEAADGRAAWFASSASGTLHRFDVGGGATALPRTFGDLGDLGYDARRGVLLLPLVAADRIERLAP